MTPDILSARLPPQDIPAETVVLGSMILAPEGRVAVMERVTAEDFYRPTHVTIFSAIVALADANEPVDGLTLRSKLISMGQFEAVGGAEYLCEIVDGTPSAANAGYYAGIVREKSLLRRLIQIGTELAGEAYRPDADLEALLTQYQQALLMTDPRIAVGDRKAVTLAAAMKQALSEAEAAGRAGRILGIYSGLADLDAATGGLRFGENVLIGGRTGNGKSTLGLAIVLAAARQGEQCLIVSGEMPARQVAGRALQASAGVWGTLLRSGQLSVEHWNALNAAEIDLAPLPIYIIGRKLTVPEIAVEARRLEARTKAKVRVVMVDTLQLMRPHTRGSLYEQMTAKSEAAKELALEQDCIVLSVSQFGRDEDRRVNPPLPTIHDLKGTGSLENDADLVLLMHSPKRDDGSNYQHPADRLALEVWLRVGKGRGTGETRWPLEGGQETGGIRLRWWPGFTRFQDWAPSPGAGVPV